MNKVQVDAEGWRNMWRVCRNIWRNVADHSCGRGESRLTKGPQTFLYNQYFGIRLNQLSYWIWKHYITPQSRNEESKILHGVQNQKYHPLSTAEESLLIKTHIQWVTMSVSPRLKRPRREANHSSPLVTKQRTSGAIPSFLYMLSWCGQEHYLLTSDRNICEEWWVAIQEWHWTVAGLLEITRTDGQTVSFYTVFSKTCRSEGLSCTAILQQQQMVCYRQRSADKTVVNEIKLQKNSG